MEPWPLLEVPRTRRILIGVSGGLDSVVLLHALHAAGCRKMTVAHLNHGLRGRAGTADARHVEKLAARLGLRFYTGRVEVKALALREKSSIETAARAARYAFFARAARAERCRTLVLAHHADDQVETFLFNLLRGGGPAGLSGMRPVSHRVVQGVRLAIIRPLLPVWRSELEAYAASHGLTWRQDASNASLEHTRNRLRHRVLPMLAREFGRDVRQSLWRAAELISAEQQWLAECVTQTTPALAVKDLRALGVAPQRREIHAWLRRMEVPQVSFRLVEEIRALIPQGARTARVNLPGARFARRQAGRLFIQP